MINLPKLKATSGELLHLDLLRFIASVGIVFHHSLEFFVSPSIRAEFTFSRTGGLALFVDLFFMISGFVIAYVYTDSIQQKNGYRRFLQRRFSRIFPLHLLTFFAVFSLYGLLSFVGLPVNKSPSSDIGCIAQTIFLLHGIFPCGNGIYFNGASWSISAELVMYLCFPLFASMARWHRWLPIALAVFVLVIIFFIQTKANNIIYFDWTNQSAPLRALPSFLLGIGVFNFRSSIARLPSSGTLFWVSVTALTFSMLKDAPTLLTLILVYLTVVITVAADAQGGTRFVKRLAPLGQLTYSIYMWHGLIIMIIINGIGDKLLHASGGLMLALVIFCYMCIYMVSYISFFFIETPARRGIDRLKVF